MKKTRKITLICIQILFFVLSFLPIVRYAIAITPDVISVSYYSVFYLLVIRYSRVFIISAMVEILRVVVLAINIAVMTYGLVKSDDSFDTLSKVLFALSIILSLVSGFYVLATM